MVKSVLTGCFCYVFLGLAGSAMAIDAFGPTQASPARAGGIPAPQADVQEVDADAPADELGVHIFTGPELKYCTADINNDGIVDAGQSQTFIFPAPPIDTNLGLSQARCHACSWNIAEGARDCSQAGLQGLSQCMSFCADGLETQIVTLLLTEWCECKAKPQANPMPIP